jgi:hypothetical protein
MEYNNTSGKYLNNIVIKTHSEKHMSDMNEINNVTENIDQVGGAKKNTKTATKTTKDGYIRPQRTFQDMMTPAEIAQRLDGFIKIKTEEIYSVPIDTTIRYFTTVGGEKKFRIGGRLSLKEPGKKYIMLSSDNNKRFSVQVNDSVEFWIPDVKALVRKDDDSESEENNKSSKASKASKMIIPKECILYINHLENRLKTYQSQILTLQRENNEIGARYNELERKFKKLLKKLEE